VLNNQRIYRSEREKQIRIRIKTFYGFIANILQFINDNLVCLVLFRGTALNQSRRTKVEHDGILNKSMAENRTTSDPHATLAVLQTNNR
jgi:hypothetical protein